MAILLDTGFLVAHYSARDSHKARAEAIMEEILDGEHGTPFVSDYVVLEFLNYASSARGTAARLRGVQGHLLAKGDGHWVELVNIDERLFDASVEFYTRYGVQKGLSFTDCSTVVLGKAMGIERVASAKSTKAKRSRLVMKNSIPTANRPTADTLAANTMCRYFETGTW